MVTTKILAYIKIVSVGAILFAGVLSIGITQDPVTNDVTLTSTSAEAGFYDCLGTGQPCSSTTLRNQTQKCGWTSCTGLW